MLFYFIEKDRECVWENVWYQRKTLSAHGLFLDDDPFHIIHYINRIFFWI